MTAEADALEVARQLADAGVPIFVAYPHPSQAGEYRPPSNWQKTQPNRAYVDAWKPGLALCAVMGCGIDLIDIDPRNGGNIVELFRTTSLPDIIGSATTPSGGQHLFITSMDVGSRDSVMPGIDIKAGDADGNGRGFAYIAPTVRVSKTTGELAPYTWADKPDPRRINGYRDTTSALADLVRRTRQATRQTLFTDPAPLERKHAGPIPYGEHHPRLVAYAGWLRSMGLPLQPEAETLMRRRLQDLVQPADATRPKYTEDEALGELHDVYRRYAAGDSAAEQQTDTGLADMLPEVDLGLLAAQGRPERPDLICDMLYRAAVHCLAGAPGGGKTTLMLWWMLTHIRNGGRVMLLDEESGQEQAVEKLLDLGADPAELRPPAFTYVPFPARRWTPTDIGQLHALITDREPQIVGWDSVAAFLAIRGADENSAPDVTRFWQEILVPCARQFGAAVIGIDHTIKTGEHGGYGRGSGAKKAASDVQYILETIRPFNRQQSGLLRLTTSPGKDRRGWLCMAYDIAVDVGDAITIRTSEAAAKPSSDGWTEQKNRLWEALNVRIEDSPAGVTWEQINDWLRAKYSKGINRSTASTYLNELSADGYVDHTVDGRFHRWFPILLPVGNASPERVVVSSSSIEDDNNTTRQFRQPT